MFGYYIRMPKLNNVLFLLNPKAASMAATANKRTRRAARIRMTSPRGRMTRLAYEAPKRRRALKKSRNLNEIYNSLNRVGMINRVRGYNINEFIKYYENALNFSLTGKEHQRLINKMKKWKSELINEIVKRNIIHNKLRMNSLFNMSSQGSTPNYNR